ncbi:hypothetical protein [Qipengyuania sp. ASV99]|uniref:hypothetical protein n=1 Tax=Qipengyuania sp. ASV99 TaxID=3399681 RepID=UPI003A4C6321
MAIDAHLSGAESPREWHLPADAVAALQSLNQCNLTREAFLGEWCDPRDLMLIKRGSGEVEGLGQVSDIRYDKLGEAPFRSWGGATPDCEEPGQYAYAFSCPPYSLEGPSAKIQRLFKASTELLLGRGERIEIFDWSRGDLTRVHPLFEAGMEWWGVFLFTIFKLDDHSMFVISGSTTD